MEIVLVLGGCFCHLTYVKYSSHDCEMRFFRKITLLCAGQFIVLKAIF